MIYIGTAIGFIIGIFTVLVIIEIIIKHQQDTRFKH